MVAIFHDMIEKTMEVFMDDFSEVFGNSFSSCLSHLDKMLQRCEDTNLVLNWEKCTLWSRKGSWFLTTSLLSRMLSQYFSGGFCCSKNLMSLSVIKKEQKISPPTTFLDLKILMKKEITETFPLETLGMVTFRGDNNAPWFADFANYHAGNFV
ncbi:hypothetical protein Tco_0314219 [Tanacetum coccineum]